jgi:hypothetical protein
MNNSKMGKWAKKLKEEIEKLGFACIGQCES